MKGDFVVNIPRLRDQSEKFLTEKRIADHLSESIKNAQSQADPEKVNVYRTLLNQVNALSVFYSKMSKAAGSTANDVAALMEKSKIELEDNAIANRQRFHLDA